MKRYTKFKLLLISYGGKMLKNSIGKPKLWHDFVKKEWSNFLPSAFVTEFNPFPCTVCIVMSTTASVTGKNNCKHATKKAGKSTVSTCVRALWTKKKEGKCLQQEFDKQELWSELCTFRGCPQNCKNFRTLFSVAINLKVTL